MTWRRYISPLGTLSGGTKRTRRRVNCTGSGFRRVTQRITRKGTRPLNRKGSYQTSDGVVVYPRDGYYYARYPDGSLVKGQGTYAQGVPCPTCIKITPMDPIGIDFDPGDWTIEFNEAIPIEIEYQAPEIPAIPDMPLMPEDMGFMAEDVMGCADYRPVYDTPYVDAENLRFLRVWVASGLAGTDEDFTPPRLTDREYDKIAQYMREGGRSRHVVLDRKFPSSVKFVKGQDLSRGELYCREQFDPGAVSYIRCFPLADADITGGHGGTTNQGNMIVEIRYTIPDPYGNGRGVAYIKDQKRFYNVGNDTIDLCDPWEKVAEDSNRWTDKVNTPVKDRTRDMAVIKTTTKKRAGGADCPPPQNCEYRDVPKTLYVSAKPSSGAIEIPVAYERIVCEGDAPEPAQIDCDDLLQALKQAVDDGGAQDLNRLAPQPQQLPPGDAAPSMVMNQGQMPVLAPMGPLTVNGLGFSPGSPILGGKRSIGGGTASTSSQVPDDWCQDCTTKLVRATAYVTDKPRSGAVPFTVKMKVMVCDTQGAPKIDCATAVKALQEGIQQKGYSALNGLGSAMPMPDDFTLDRAAEQVEAGTFQQQQQQKKTNWLPWALGVAAIGGYLISK